MSEGDDPAKFLELFSTLLLKAQTANFKLSEEDKAAYFLRALPVTYESLKSEWKSLQRIKEITKQPTSTFEDLRGMFNTYIADFKRQDEVRLQTAMMVRKASHGQQRRHFGQGQQRNHNKDQNNKKALSCWNCGKQGHSSKDCRAPRIGDGYAHKPKGLSHNRFNNHHNKPTDDLAALHRNMAGAAIQEVSEEDYAALVKEESIEWLVDLGASSHICNNKEVFSQLEKLAFPKRFRTASGSATVSEHGGRVTMKLPQDQSAIGHLTLHDVVLMEYAPANLLSQGTLLAKGWDVDITQHGGMISKHGVNIPVYKTGPGGTLRAFRLPLKKDFYIESEQQQAVVSVDEKIKRKEQGDLYLTVQDKDTIQGWHNRLGHMGVSAIKKLAASGQLHITDKDSSTFKMEECEVCAIAKTTRLTFGDISVTAQEPLEIVHSDITGPLKPDINGNIYYVTFIDDLTGLTCIGGLRNKTAMDVLGCFKNFKKITELAFNRKVQCLRTDGGGEYLGGMKPYLQLHGIVHQVTTPYTPQLNGTAERANRTLKEMCSSMLIAAVTGSSRESTTDTRARSTDNSIHLSPARQGEPDSLGADSVAPTSHRNNNTSPIHITNRYRDLKVHDNSPQDLENLTRRT
jgi:hypothetical protein